MCFLQPMIMRRVGDGTSHHALMQQIRRLQGRVHVLRLSNAAAAVDVADASRGAHLNLWILFCDSACLYLSLDVVMSR